MADSAPVEEVQVVSDSVVKDPEVAEDLSHVVPAADEVAAKEAEVDSGDGGVSEEEECVKDDAEDENGAADVNVHFPKKNGEANGVDQDGDGDDGVMKRKCEEEVEVISEKKQKVDDGVDVEIIEPVIEAANGHSVI